MFKLSITFTITC